MLSSRLFWKLFLAYAGLIVLTVGSSVAIVAGWQDDQLVHRVTIRLNNAAILLRSQYSDSLNLDSNDQTQQSIRALGQEIETRITLVDAEGKVLADSQQPTLEEVSGMENHLAREEFVQAAADGKGSAQRVSPTLGIPFLYCAVAVHEGGRLIGFVRTAQPVAEMRQQADAMRRLISLVGLIIGLTGLVVTYWLTGRIISPIRELTSAADNIAAGHYPNRIDVSTDDELGVLARSFEKMSSNLDNREQQLREGAQRQKTVLGSMMEGVLALDERQHVLFANVAAGRIFSFDPVEVEGRALMEVARSNDLRLIVQEALEFGKPCRGEIEWVSGNKLMLDVQATPLPGDPSPGIVLVLHDISELKRLEGVRQEFIANVSHELKTPLSSIKAYTETLLTGALEDSEHARRFLTRIEDQSDRLNDLIIDMLAIARIESGMSAIELADISLSDAMNRCTAEYEARAEAAEIDLKIQGDTTDCRVKADEEALQQILGNLIDNAIKYTPAGGAVTVESHREGGQAVVSVTDTGPGIAPEHHGRLFERFYRVDKARSREVGGTGLGLSIVKHLCQAIGGSIELQSELGHGSTFRVLLPLALVEGEP